MADNIVLVIDDSGCCSGEYEGDNVDDDNRWSYWSIVDDNDYIDDYIDDINYDYIDHYIIDDSHTGVNVIMILIMVIVMIILMIILMIVIMLYWWSYLWSYNIDHDNGVKCWWSYWW